MAVLVTGATGLVGSHLVPALLREGYDVIATCRSRLKAEALFGEERANPRLRIHEGDLTRPAFVDEALSAAPERIVHLAALRGQGASRVAYEALHVDATRRLLTLAERGGVSLFIFASTVGVLGTSPTTCPASCLHEPNPDTLYHRTKYAGETLVEEYARRGNRSFIFRPSIIYGSEAGGFPGLLRTLAARRLLLLPRPDVRIHLLSCESFVDLILRALERPTVGPGPWIAGDRDPVYLTDAVRALSIAARGRPYPRLLRFPRVAYRLLAFLAAELGMETWYVRFRLFGYDWHYDIERTKRDFAWEPDDTLRRLETFGRQRGWSLFPIARRWPVYFQDPEEGLGTAYERDILERIFRAADGRFSFGSVLEAPSFGMTGVSGINSLWWARGGKKVVVLDSLPSRVRATREVWRREGLHADFIAGQPDALPFPDKSIDLVWNFAALCFVRDWEDAIAEMLRVARKAVLISVPNRRSLGYRARWWYCRGQDGFFPQSLDEKRLKGRLGLLGWRIVWEDFMDIPPWPDVPVRMWKRGAPGEGKGGEKPGRVARRFGALERAPRDLAQFWAHHVFLLAVPGSGAGASAQ